MNIRIWNGAQVETVAVQPGQTLLDVLRDHGTTPPAPCGGRGTCGKCRVVLEPGGPVLACQTPAQDGMVVHLPTQQTQQVLLCGTDSGLFSPDPGLTGCGVACDIGTTTVVCHLIDLAQGRTLATVGEGNRQQSFGADVISRIHAASQGHLEALQQAIVEQLSRMIRQLCRQAAVELSSVHAMTVAANTTMCHLLTGLDPTGLGCAPFTPVSYFGTEHAARALGLPFDGTVYLAPAVSGYVGGDITADVVAVGMTQRETPALLIDVGTNGEMVLGCGEKLLCCSTAAGPAFEGAQICHGMTAQDGAIHRVDYRDGQVVCAVLGDGPARGICGSGLIDAIAVMLELGALDETGRLLDVEEDDIPDTAKPYLFLLEDETPAFRLTETVWVTQADVRKVQLGKGAIAAGEQVLLDAYGVPPESIGALYLAGGFGSYIRPESAARIGLIPQALLPVTSGVGNAAAEGAGMALVSAQVRRQMNVLTGQMTYIELSGNAAFNQAYLEEMIFPEGKEV